MIKPLRRYHFVIWQFMAVLLPLCFIMAIVVRPSLPARSRMEDQLISVWIASKTDSTDVITIELGNSVTGPSCVVMLLHPLGEVVLGTMDHQGVYTFVTRKVDLPATLKLWDAINHRSIHSIRLTEKK